MNSPNSYGYVQLDGWAGRTEKRVKIVAETPKMYRIEALEDTRLAGRFVYLLKGDTRLVPKHAVRLDATGGRS
jgi:hypothetical protein